MGKKLIESQLGELEGNQGQQLVTEAVIEYPAEYWQELVHKKAE